MGTTVVLKTLYSPFSGGRTGTALLILRAFVGIAFLFDGYGKIADVAAFAAEFQLPSVLALTAAYAQFVSGMLLIVGLFTPLAGCCLAGTMAVAT